VSHSAAIASKGDGTSRAATRVGPCLRRDRKSGSVPPTVLDEPTTGLHPEDVERLLAQLDRLVEAGNTVVVVEHDMRVIAASDHVVDMGPGAGEAGGTVVAAGTPAAVAEAKESRTARFLKSFLKG
jgi:excinuclease ABC subunit A